MRDYLLENENCSSSKNIFSIRSQTLDIKEWKPWNYEDNLCVKCSIFAETMDHFVTCESYEENTEKNWREIFQDNVERQKEIGRFIEKRFNRRKVILEKQEAGQTLDPAPTLQLHLVC